jgi:hypothetical protein
MIERDFSSDAVAAQIGQIVGEACREAFKWLVRHKYGIDYVPPLFVDCGELPIVPRIAPPRIDGAARRDTRR